MERVNANGLLDTHRVGMMKVRLLPRQPQVLPLNHGEENFIYRPEIYFTVYIEGL